MTETGPTVEYDVVHEVQSGVLLVDSPTVSRKIKAVAWGGVVGGLVTVLAALGIDVPDPVAERAPELIDAATIVAPWLVGLIAGYFTREKA